MIDPSNRYGFIRKEEADLIDWITEDILIVFGEMRFLEVGVFSADTVRGLVRRCAEIGFSTIEASGVDFEQYRPNPLPAPCGYTFYGGDSMDMWRSIHPNEAYNFLFVDGCHCCNHAMCDFLNYSPFVEVGGWCLFHDTALPKGQAKQEEWPQTDHSYAGKPPSVLGVREGLTKLGLLQGYRKDWEIVKEVPSDTGLMGMCLFKRVL